MSHIDYVDGWPQPYRLPDAEPFWAALQEERLTHQRCGHCKQVVWPAHSYCPHCSAQAPTWEASSGLGTVYSFSAVMRGPTPVWADITPYTVGFVEMAEGHFLFTQFDVPPEGLRIGQPVQARFIRRGAQTLPIFKPV
jgi:uncharacterized OB-fold protein